MAKSVKKPAGKSSGTRKRELISPRGDKRFVRRDEQGQFTESDDQGRSLSRDVKQKSKTASKPGQGDRGDRAPTKAAKKKAAPKKAAAKKAASKKSVSKKSAPKKAGTKKAATKKSPRKK